METAKSVTFKHALVMLLCIVVILSVGNAILKIPTEISFMLTIVAISLVAMSSGFKLKELQDYFIDGCKDSLIVVLIMMSVGMVIGSWIVSGIVPSIIYYGLKFISPAYFLVSGFLLLCLVSFFIGSSFATAGTLGIALMGIGLGMGIPPAITAGMVISGSLFGNKISPFADTTNLCLAVAKVDLVDHIKSMLYSVIPILVISATIYTYLGLSFAKESLDQSKLDLITVTLAQNFTINPLLLLVPILTIILAIRKMPPVIALLLAALAGVAVAFICQPYNATAIFAALSKGFSIKSGVPQVDALLNRGGIASMTSIITLVIFILGFGQILQRTGVVTVLLDKVQSIIRGSTSLVLTTLFTGLLTDMLTASQYMSILLPGQILGPAYKRLKIKMTVLSRTLEDGGTMFSYIIPWSITALYLSGVLGLPVIEMVPYAYQAWLTPFLAVFYAVTGIAIWKEEDSPPEEAGQLTEQKQPAKG